VTADSAQGDGRVTREDLEEELRATTGASDGSAARHSTPLALVGILFGVAVVSLAWVLGRRAGRLRSTVVEVRRI
jgi:hypothetical protein